MAMDLLFSMPRLARYVPEMPAANSLLNRYIRFGARSMLIGASTSVYADLRADVDGTEEDEVYVEEEDQDESDDSDETIPSDDFIVTEDEEAEESSRQKP